MADYTLGDLLAALKKATDDDRPDKWVYYDFANLSPTNLASSRGDYSEVALGWESANGYALLSDLIAHIEQSIGNTMEGYKGGTYTICAECPIWADNWGRWTGTKITGVTDIGYAAIITTRSDEDAT